MREIDINYSNLKLTEKYFSHAKGHYYRDWNNDLLKILAYHLPTYENGIIEFFCCVRRVRYAIRFSSKTGECLGITQYFKNTKIEMSIYIFPLIELISILASSGYLEYKNTESEH